MACLLFSISSLYLKLEEIGMVFFNCYFSKCATDARDLLSSQRSSDIFFQMEHGHSGTLDLIFSSSLFDKFWPNFFTEGKKVDQIMIPGCYSRLKRKGNERIQEKKKVFEVYLFELALWAGAVSFLADLCEISCMSLLHQNHELGLFCAA